MPGRSVITALTPCEADLRSSAVLTVHTCRSRPVAASRRGERRRLPQQVDAGPQDPVVADHALQHRPVLASSRSASPAAAPGRAGASAAARCRRSSSRAPAHPAPVQPNVASASARRARPARRTASGAWSRWPARRAGRSPRPPPGAGAGSARLRVARRRGPRTSSSRSAQGFFHDAKSSWSRSARSIVETRPRRGRRTPQVAVVHAHEVAVRGEPDVALERVGTHGRAPSRRRRGCARRCRGSPRDGRRPVASRAAGPTADLCRQRARPALSRAAVARPARRVALGVDSTKAIHSSVPAGPRVSSSWPKITCGSDSTRRRPRAAARRSRAMSSTPR